MPRNMPTDFRTFGFVLKRTNYGEADRIINIITPKGKVSAIARGARKNKSKLAGGIEMFSQIDFNLHQGKSDLAVVTGAKMIKYYGEILKSFERMELAGKILKSINRASENSENQAYYEMTEQSLDALNDGLNIQMIDGWFYVNMRKAMGEELNFYRDARGESLNETKRYNWDELNEEFVEKENGRYGSNEIKYLRILSTMKLKMIAKIRVDEGTFNNVMDIIRIVKG